MTEPADAPERITGPPSLVDLACEALRRMIIGGQLLCGQRIVENRLTTDLGISRPPLREALRVLEREGLVQAQPRKGVVVTPLTLHDVYEIVTLRAEYERMAVRLGVPCRDQQRLQRCRDALAGMAEAVDGDDQPSYLQCSLRFHVALVGLAGHERLEQAYRSLQLQMMLAMARNRRARETGEDLRGDLSRHRRLLALVEDGDPQQVLAELARHGDRTFLDDIEAHVDGHTEVALRWLAQHRGEQEEQ